MLIIFTAVLTIIGVFASPVALKILPNTVNIYTKTVAPPTILK